MTVSFRSLNDTPADRELLVRCYEDLYLAAFPNPDERESLQNLLESLRLKSAGWYGPNNYRVLFGWQESRLVAASVSLFLADCNCGIIEFLLVEKSCRGTGIGRLLHAATLDALNHDARRLGAAGIDGVLAELNDPFLVRAEEDSHDPFERVMLWDRWGYRRLCFPYVQPSLSVTQAAVECLLLGIKPFQKSWRDGMPSVQVLRIVAGYMRWSMRIDAPFEHPDYTRMRQALENQSVVRVEPLAAYTGFAW